MAVALNHTIVNVRNKEVSAKFYAELLGLPAPIPALGWFMVVQLANGVSLDFCDDDRPEPIDKQHYAFLVSDAEFDLIFARIQAKNLPYWADPGKKLPGQHNTHFGGRGVYWDDPDGHILEIITRPYAI